MPNRPSFEGFEELIRRPLENSDPFSYQRVIRVLGQLPTAHSAPFTFLLRRLVGKRLTQPDAKQHWQQIIVLKERMQAKLGHVIDIQTASVEHFAMQERGEQMSVDEASTTKRSRSRLLKNRHHNPEAPDYYLARLKDELLRSRRYSHPLSAIMVDMGELPLRKGAKATQEPEEKLIAVVRIVERTIRAVDILTPCGPDRFLIILPDTNLREADELAERIRASVAQRTTRMELFTEPVAVAIASAQCGPNDTAAVLVRSLEQALPSGENAPT